MNSSLVCKDILKTEIKLPPATSNNKKINELMIKFKYPILPRGTG